MFKISVKTLLDGQIEKGEVIHLIKEEAELYTMVRKLTQDLKLGIIKDYAKAEITNKFTAQLDVVDMSDKTDLMHIEISPVNADSYRVATSSSLGQGLDVVGRFLWLT